MSSILIYGCRNIIRDKMSKIISLILMILAVVSYVVFPTAGKSAFKSIMEYGFKDRVLVMEKDNLKLAFSRVGEDLYEFVKTAPHVKHIDNEPLVSPYLQMSSVLGNQFLMLRGINDIFYKLRGKTFTIIQGRKLRDQYDILIGHRVSKRLGKPYKVGDILPLENRKWKIVGIFTAKRDPAESGALVKMADFKEVSARGNYSYIEIKADNPKNIPKLMGYVNMAFEMLHDEFPDSPAIMALPEKQYWSKLAGMFKMSVLVSKVKSIVIFVSILLFIMNIFHSCLDKRSPEIERLLKGGTGRAGLFFALMVEVLAVSVVAGIIGGFIAISLSGTAINLQLATILLNIGPPALVKGVMVAVILGFLGTIFPILKLCFYIRQKEPS